jgi:hypothetical protein
MKDLLIALASVLVAMLLNAAIGAGIALLLGLSPAVGAMLMIAVGIVVGAIKKRPGSSVLRAGIFVEVWLGELIEKFRTAAEQVAWYGRIPSYDNYVKNDVIHFVDVGGDPEVLVNNTTYPLEIEDLSDGDKAVSLDKFQSKPTRITDDELHAISYDKMSVVIEKHKDVFVEVRHSRAIHSIAPAGDTDTTPVILTSGAASDGRKSLTRSDIIAMKKKFDKMNIPVEGRILVLCPDHVADLLEQDQKFSQQYYNYESGKVMNLYGFDVYEYTQCPYYTVATKKKLAYGAIAGDGDMQASVAFTLKRVMRADGSTKVYLRDAATSPETQSNLFSMRTYNVCLPLKSEGLGAIVSAKA